MPGIYEIILL